jgi:hypothetical protein
VNDLRSLNQRRFPLQAVLVALFLLLALFGSSSQRTTALFWLLGMLALYVIVIIHELGHLIAGLSVGYRFSIFSVGLVHIYRENDKLRISWRRLPWQPANFLGFTLFFIDDYTDFRRRMFWYVLGGPLANALVVVVAGLLYANRLRWPIIDEFSTPAAVNTTFITTVTWNIFIFCTFWEALLLLLGSSYPSAWVSTDGNKILRLLRGGATLDRFKAQVQVGSAVLQGVRPRDWNPAWIDALTVLKDDSADTVNASLLLYRWYLDRGDVQQAETHLTTAVKLRKKIGPADRANILVEAAYFEMRYHANAQNAEQWIKKLGKEQKRAQAIPRLRMACAANLILKQYAETKQVAQQAIEVLDRAKANDGFSIMERDLFRDMANHAVPAAETPNSALP